MRRRILRMLTVLDIWTMYSFSLSLSPCTKHWAWYLSLSVFAFLTAMIIRPAAMLASSEMLRSGTNSNDFRANRPSISC